MLRLDLAGVGLLAVAHHLDRALDGGDVDRGGGDDGGGGRRDCARLCELCRRGCAAVVCGASKPSSFGSDGCSAAATGGATATAEAALAPGRTGGSGTATLRPAGGLVAGRRFGRGLCSGFGCGLGIGLRRLWLCVGLRLARRLWAWPAVAGLAALVLAGVRRGDGWCAAARDARTQSPPRPRAARACPERILESQRRLPSVRFESSISPTIAIALIRLTKAKFPGNAATVGRTINAMIVAQG